jgi:hypothetical protein
VIQSGDIFTADLNAEVRFRVLVVSTERFHRISGRSLVAPEVFGESSDPVNFPWRVRVDDAVFAIDLMRSVAIEHLLERLDRAPARAMQTVRRVLLAIT